MKTRMDEAKTLPRRQFLKGAAGIVGAATQALSFANNGMAEDSVQAGHNNEAEAVQSHAQTLVSYPRVFRGRQLKMIAFPLGGVAAGSLSLGGRGQLRDWEIFNRPDKGKSPSYAFPAIWIQTGNETPIAHVLESRILPPYEGQDGLGSHNAPGLSRLQAATFTGEFPLAHIEFEDERLPVKVQLDAFSPFIPHDPDDSGLPAAILRYRISNPGTKPAKVSIAFSIDNPIAGPNNSQGVSPDDKRVNEYRRTEKLAGLIMTDPSLVADDPMKGSFVLASLSNTSAAVTYWRGWPQGGWWNSPLLFWDTFSATGQLKPEPESRNTVGAVCQQTTIEPGESSDLTFILAWHFPNRTPDWCGWGSPKDEGKTVIGNFYATRFKDAWEVASYLADNLSPLEQRTRQFVDAMRDSTLPAVVKEAATANLSTLVSTTCFRTADGEFHGFEGSYDHIGCCYGNCTHVWNYESATAFLFPTFSRSLRKAAFGFSLDSQGALHARQMLPDGKERDPIVAADGQMGEIMHAYLDWKLSGDGVWLKSMWPQVKRAIEFAWTEGSWDSGKQGVSSGVQNNTYDVAFLGPNPMCGIYYLGALRAGEEMARWIGDDAAAMQYRALFEKGSSWIDSHLFNGDFYVQRIEGFHLDQVAPVLRAGLSGSSTVDPQYQVGEGCLIDQLIGQYLASLAGLGPLVSPQHIEKTLRSIYAFNHKRTMENHDSVERTFALNDEAAMVICDYGRAERPRIPFPYFGEVMTGFEYSTAALMIFSGMADEGLECIGNIRARYNGEKRNPWDEAECGHHYARAMASWTAVVAMSGFHYDGASASVIAAPQSKQQAFCSIWATGTGWGTFSCNTSISGRGNFELRVLEGDLPLHSCEIVMLGAAAKVKVDEASLEHVIESREGRSKLVLHDPIVLKAHQVFRVEIV